jgi:hypothetical protein
MQYGSILNIGSLPDFDRKDIATQYRIEPHIGIITNFHISDNPYAIANQNILADFGYDAFIRHDGGLSFST